MKKNSNIIKMLPVIITLAWPTMLEQLMQTAVQYIDAAMVGSLGTSATAAVGSTTTINWLVNSSISALGVGFLAYIAKAIGAGEREKAKKASGQAVLAVIVVGIFFTVLTLALSPFVPKWMQVDESIQKTASQYFFILYAPMLARTATSILGMVLRSAGDTKTPMLISIYVNIINIVLNFLLIYPTRKIFGITVLGAGLGVIGAGVASALSFLFGGIAITVCLYRHPEISPKGQKITPDGEVLKPCLKVALPNMLQRFGTSLGYVAFAAMINSLGEAATAAHTIANTVESAFYIPGYGMQTASATLAGNAYGARDKKRMKYLARATILIETVLMCISGGLLFAFAPAMVSLFSKTPEIIALGSIVLRMVALSEPVYGISIVLEGMMQGVGCTKVPFVFNIVGMWGVRIVGTFICITFFGGTLVSAWGCMIAHNILLFFMFLVYYLSNKWNPIKA